MGRDAGGRLLTKLVWPFEFIAALAVGVPMGILVGMLMSIVVWAAAAAMVFSAAREALLRRSRRENAPRTEAAGGYRAAGPSTPPASAPNVGTTAVIPENARWKN